MQRFVLRRFIAAVFALLVVAVVVFGIARLQGDPRYLYVTDVTDKAAWEEMGVQMGLDRPLVVQFGIFLRDLLRGDLGKSIHRQVSVTSILGQRLPASAQLALGAFVFTIAVGIPLGIFSAMNRGTVWDYLGRTFAVLGHSMPAFVTGLALMLIFSVWLGWLPTGRRGGLAHYILPCITMGWVTSAGLLRLVRSSMLEVLDSEYIKFARAKGVSGTMVIWKHALRNAIITPLTYVGLTLAWMVTGSIMIEFVFSWPGLGLLSIESISTQDYPLLQGVVLVVSLAYIGMSFLVDILYGYLDPRIRYG